MSSSERRAASDLGGMSRRELVAAMARWTVPTVLTISLGARAAYAAASCPPCTKKVGGICRACSVNEIMACQCEPCLGPPFCGRPPAGGGVFGPAPPAAQRFGATNPSAQTQELYRALRRRRTAETENLFGTPFGSRADSLMGRTSRAPFGRGGQAAPDVRRLRERSQTTQGLYDRLRQFDDRRRP